MACASGGPWRVQAEWAIGPACEKVQKPEGGQGPGTHSDGTEPSARWWGAWPGPRRKRSSSPKRTWNRRGRECQFSTESQDCCGISREWNQERGKKLLKEEVVLRKVALGPNHRPI